MSSYQPPNPPPPLPPSFNASYFESRGFLTLSQATELFLPKVNPNVAGNLSVAGTTTLAATNINGTTTLTAPLNADTSIRVGGSGATTINGIYSGQSANLTLPATAVTTFTVSYGSTITGTKRIFPSVVYISGTGNKNFIVHIKNIGNTSFDIDIHNDSSSANTIQIAWLMLIV